MESRFRWFTHKRERDRSELEFRTFDYETASKREKEPILIYQSLGKQHKTRLGAEQGLALKAFSYDMAQSGTAPVFIDAAVKGNGPVKLQTSRRLSSGELHITSEDSTSTLNNIRSGDYIVGHKSQAELSPRSPNSLAWSSQYSSPTSANQTWTAQTTPTLNESISPIASPMLVRPMTSSAVTHPSMAGLGVLPFSSYEWSGSTPDFNHISLAKLTDDTNSTIAALQKAEQSRLDDLYHRTSVNEDLQLVQPKPTTRYSPLAAGDISIKTHTRVLPPRQHTQQLSQATADAEWLRTESSSAYSISRDDDSESSSHHRSSFISSFAGASSCTTQASLGEAEHLTAKDDIRKVIADMRSTYLKALDSLPTPLPQTTLSQAIASKSVKKKRRGKLAASPSINSGSASSPAMDRQTWHGSDRASKGAADERAKRRVASHVVAWPGRLSPIDASPLRKETGNSPPPGSERRIRRADSQTLGSLMAGFGDGTGYHFSSEESAPSPPPQTVTEEPKTPDHSSELPSDWPLESLLEPRHWPLCDSQMMKQFGTAKSELPSISPSRIRSDNYI